MSLDCRLQGMKSEECRRYRDLDRGQRKALNPKPWILILNPKPRPREEPGANGGVELSIHGPSPTQSRAGDASSTPKPKTRQQARFGERGVIALKKKTDSPNTLNPERSRASILRLGFLLKRLWPGAEPAGRVEGLRGISPGTNTEKKDNTSSNNENKNDSNNNTRNYSSSDKTNRDKMNNTRNDSDDKWRPL